jgi:hypothetical protein
MILTGREPETVAHRFAGAALPYSFVHPGFRCAPSTTPADSPASGVSLQSKRFETSLRWQQHCYRRPFACPPPLPGRFHFPAPVPRSGPFPFPGPNPEAGCPRAAGWRAAACGRCIATPLASAIVTQVRRHRAGAPLEGTATLFALGRCGSVHPRYRVPNREEYRSCAHLPC